MHVGKFIPKEYDFVVTTYVRSFNFIFCQAGDTVCLHKFLDICLHKLQWNTVSHDVLRCIIS